MPLRRRLTLAVRCFNNYRMRILMMLRNPRCEDIATVSIATSEIGLVGLCAETHEFVISNIFNPDINSV